jgi:hypothetical protein
MLTISGHGLFFRKQNIAPCFMKVCSWLEQVAKDIFTRIVADFSTFTVGFSLSF